MTFSICIPNYNYEHYLGRTLQSVMEQEYQDFEVVIADNASTDRSVEIARAFGDPRIRVSVNARNVGFAGNLDRAGRMATGEVMIMLSSDDLMRPDALATYRNVFEAVEGERAVLCATADRIDAEDAPAGHLGPDPALWTEADRHSELEARLGAPVYRVDAATLLQRCLQTMKNPFNFLATAYPRALYEAVEGYGGGRLMNPDKWFHWKLLTAADTAYFIDRPLFAYRWHANNQTAQQARMGALKYLVDEYVATLELEAEVLHHLGLTRDAVIDAFIEYDVARHGLATLARGNRAKARRILRFGRAVYPAHARRNARVRGLAALVSLGPLGERIARTLYGRYHRRQADESGAAVPAAGRSLS